MRQVRYGHSLTATMSHEVQTGADAPSVRLEGVTKRFGDFAAVRDMDLDIPRGQFFTMLGPSGCGKTTTLRMVAGFEEPTEGRVLLDGDDVTGLPAFRRPTNTVFQSYALFPHRTVEQNVAFGLQRQKVDRSEIKRRVAEELERVGLAPEAKRKPAQLSGGQQQRVALARALVNRPAVLLLDEPLGALDLKLRKQLQVELKRIQRDVGITFIYVTHDQEEALTMSDRIAVMNRGVVEQVSDPETVYERPAHDLRRRVHRRLQPDAGRGHLGQRRRRAAAPGRGPDGANAPVRRRQAGRARPRRRAPGEARPQLRGRGRARRRRASRARWRAPCTSARPRRWS